MLPVGMAFARRPSLVSGTITPRCATALPGTSKNLTPVAASMMSVRGMKAKAVNVPSGFRPAGLRIPGPELTLVWPALNSKFSLTKFELPMKSSKYAARSKG